MLPKAVSPAPNSGWAAGLRLRAPAALHLLHTSDDAAALALSPRLRGLKVRPSGTGEEGLEVAGDTGVLDAYTTLLPTAIDQSLADMRPLFGALLHDEHKENA